MRCPHLKNLLILLMTAFCALTFVGFFRSVNYSPRFEKAIRFTQQNDKTESSTEQPKVEMVQNFPNRTKYPRRQYMGDCPKIFGKVTFFVAFVTESMKTQYKVAQESIKCYLKGTNYEVLMVNLDNDEKVKKECGNHSDLFFKKHCAAATYINSTDWLVVLDADTGVANPNHCIEEWIDDRVDLIFYERFFNWEIASGNYIAKNTEYSRKFIKGWANWEWHQPEKFSGADNGVLQIHILETLIPHAKQEANNCKVYYNKATDYDTYMAYVTCCKMALGSTRLWPGKMRIYRRAHGWVRDGLLTYEQFCEKDFMMHLWKAQKVGDDDWDSPFEKNLDVSLCGEGLNGWDIRPSKNVSCEIVRDLLANYEKSAGNTFPDKARVIPHLALPDVGECFPNCDDDV